MSHHQARKVIARLALELQRAIAEEYFPTYGLAEASGLVLVGRILLVARKPLSVSTIARIGGMSRATAARRLCKLVAAGLAIKDGRVYCIDPKGLDRAYSPARIRQTAELISAAAKKLSKLTTI